MCEQKGEASFVYVRYCSGVCRTERLFALWARRGSWQLWSLRWRLELRRLHLYPQPTNYLILIRRRLRYSLCICHAAPDNMYMCTLSLSIFVHPSIHQVAEIPFVSFFTAVILLPQPSPDVCAVCFTDPAEFTVVPCGHQCGCEPCLERIRNATNVCPICRGPIKVFAACVHSLLFSNLPVQQVAVTRGKWWSLLLSIYFSIFYAKQQIFFQNIRGIIIASHY